MEISPQITVYAILILPGFIGQVIFSALTYTEKPSWSGRVVAAIVISFASYLPLTALSVWTQSTWLPTVQALVTAADKGLVAVLSTEVLFGVGCACVIGCLLSLLIAVAQNERWFYRGAARLRLTIKNGYVNQWDSVMLETAQTSWVTIVMKNGTKIQGHLRGQDLVSSERCMVLSNVIYHDTDKTEQKWEPQELLVLDGLEEVRYIRLTPDLELHNGKGHWKKIIDRLRGRGKEVCNTEPEPAAEGSATEDKIKLRVTISSDCQILTMPQKKELLNAE